MSTILSDFDDEQDLGDFVPPAERVEQRRCSASVEVVTNRNAPDLMTKIQVSDALESAGFCTQHLPYRAWSGSAADGQPRILVGLHGDHENDVAEGVTIQVVTAARVPEKLFANLDFTSRTWKVLYAITWDFQEGELPWKTITDYCKQLVDKFFDSVEVRP